MFLCQDEINKYIGRPDHIEFCFYLTKIDFSEDFVNCSW